MVAEGDAATNSVADRLGIKPDMIVQEIGWGEDVDDEVRVAIEERIDDEILDEDSSEVVDVVLLWWRDGDGDIVDALLGARGSLEEEGTIWVLTPKTGLPGHVDPGEIAEAVPTIGMSQTSNVGLGQDWMATRLVPPKSKSKK